MKAMEAQEGQAVGASQQAGAWQQASTQQHGDHWVKSSILCFSSVSSTWQNQCCYTDRAPVQSDENSGFQLWDVERDILGDGKWLQVSLWEVWTGRWTVLLAVQAIGGGGQTEEYLRVWKGDWSMKMELHSDVWKMTQRGHYGGRYRICFVPGWRQC